MVSEKLTFSPLSRRQIEADFSGGHITSDAGLLLLREVDKRHGLTQRLASVLNDPGDFAASLGLTPRQHSTGGRDRLLGISKRGVTVHSTTSWNERLLLGVLAYVFNGGQFWGQGRVELLAETLETQLGAKS